MTVGSRACGSAVQLLTMSQIVKIVSNWPSKTVFSQLYHSRPDGFTSGESLFRPSPSPVVAWVWHMTYQSRVTSTKESKQIRKSRQIADENGPSNQYIKY